MKLRAMAVSELNSYIKRQLQFDPILSQVNVVGEISNFKYHTSGHIYFTLKDDKSKIQCVMFQSHAQNLDYLPSDGEKTRISGNVSVFEREGKYQIYVNAMESVGKGNLYKAFVELKEKLEKQGYFNKKAPISKFPSSIGIVTSPTSAAIRDMITVIKRRNPNVQVIIYPSKVQGDDAKHQIACGIDYFNENPVDTIIIGRGGGSIEELWAFNEMIVLEAIYESKVPVISGVGHETDFTLSDFIADHRAATPTEAAELSVMSINQFSNHLINQRNYMVKLMTGKIDSHKMELKHNNKEKLCQLVSTHLNENKNSLLSLKESLIKSNSDYYQKHHDMINQLALRLEATSPLSTFNRGYVVAENKGEAIDSINDVEVADSIDIILKNGIIKTEVISKERKLLVNEKES